MVKKRLIEDIAEHVKAKKLDGITDINDFSDRSGMRVVIELRRDAHPRKILNYLIKHTALRSNFGVIMLALVDRQPRLLNLKQVLEYYIEHREDVVRRRSLWELRRARDRAHILEGLRIAIQFLDEIIALIRSSKNAEEARKEMMRRFGLTQIQADAILAMQLRQLTALERERVEEEFCGLLQRIAFFEDLLSSNEKIRNVIKTELRAIRDKYGDDRRTRIVAMEAEEIGDEDLIPEEETILTITRDGYIKRVPIDTYRSQRRGGRGIIGANTKEEDTVDKLFVATTHDYILFFSNRGRVYRLKAYEVPQTSSQAMGVAIINLINIEPGEIITATVPTRDLKSEEKRYLVMATVQGAVKRIDLAAFPNIRTNGLRAFDLEENDELRWVEITEGDNEIVLVTHNGMSIRFSENDVRSSGRAAGGVRGIMLAAGDRVVGMGIVRPRAELLVATERGHGKRTVLEQYRGQKRGGKGLRTMNITAKTGKIVSTQVVLPEDRVLMISRNGIIIRFRVNEVRSIGRSTQGVRLMNLGSSDELASLERIPNTEEAEKVIAAKPAPPKGSKEKAGKAGKSE